MGERGAKRPAMPDQDDVPPGMGRRLRRQPRGDPRADIQEAFPARHRVRRRMEPEVVRRDVRAPIPVPLQRPTVRPVPVTVKLLLEARILDPLGRLITRRHDRIRRLVGPRQTARDHQRPLGKP